MWQGRGVGKGLGACVLLPRTVTAVSPALLYPCLGSPLWLGGGSRVAQAAAPGALAPAAGARASGRDCPGHGLAVCRSCSWARLWDSLISLEPAACRSWGPLRGAGGCRLCLPWGKQPCRWGCSAQRGVGCPRAVPPPEHCCPRLTGLCSPRNSPPLRDSGPVTNRLTGHRRGPQGSAPAAAVAPEHTDGKKMP